MQLKIFKCLWGVTKIDEEAFELYRKTGYDGIEFKALNAKKHDGFAGWLKNCEFDFIAQIHTDGGISVPGHLRSFETLVNTALTFNPLLINSQSGCDHWTLKEKCDFIEGALKIEEAYKINIAHETHRSRITYNPWETSALVKAFPPMKICCDFSHWVNVCERLLTTEEEQISIAASACIHVHARVGYEQGPQVPDPRAPEYEKHLESHEAWWNRIWLVQKSRGIELSSVCPEYGPPLYQHTLPFTNEKVSDIEEITAWAMQRIKDKFKAIN
jgi:sugar phosphate isomerase/epimerase